MRAENLVDRTEGGPDETRGRLAPGLWIGAAALAVGAGLLLWSRQGAAVFADYLSAAVAWCF